MPPAIVAVALLNRHAINAATSAATSFGFVYENTRVAGAVNTTAGMTIAVSIVEGTKRSARAANGGISMCAKSAMNESRDR